MTPQTYCHTFRNGLSVQVTVDAPRVLGGDMGAFNFIWNRTPSAAENAEIQAEYIGWKNQIMQRFSDETGLRILDLVQVGPNDWLPRAFEPQPRAPGTEGQS